MTGAVGLRIGEEEEGGSEGLAEEAGALAGVGDSQGFRVGGVATALAHAEFIEEDYRERERGLGLPPPGGFDEPDGYPRGEPDIRYGYEDEASRGAAHEDRGGCWEDDPGFDFG